MDYGRVFVWLALYLGLLYVGMPLARALLPRLDDRGAGVALPLALAVVWLVAYFVGHASITVGLWLGIAILGVLAVALRLRGHEIDNRAYAEVAVVFAIAFLGMLLIRVFDPAAHPGGGEKFLDMGLLQSLLRGSTIPPEDPWFAGETVRYYYGGHYLASLLTRITGTEARYAYNLALAGFFGMLVTGVYGVAGSIAASRGFSRRKAAVFGAFFVGFASNLHTTARVVLGVLPDSVAEFVAGVLGVTIEGASVSLAEFHYWAASRIIPTTINEFPFFSWLNGDLHAHMMNTVVLVLVVAVLSNLYLDGTDRPRWQRLLVLFGVVPALGGMVAVVSTWSFPIVGGLVALTLALGRVSPAALLSPDADAWVRRRHPAVREVAHVGVALAAAVAVMVLAFGWSLPYWLFTASSTSGIGVLPDRSGLGGLLIVHGAFLLLFWLFTLRRFKSVVSAPVRFGGLTLFAVGYAIYADAAAVGLFVPLVVFGYVLARRAGVGLDWDRLGTRADQPSDSAADGGVERRRPGYELVLVVAVSGLVVLVEFVYVADLLAPERFNTVFKVYVQVWVLAAIAAGVVLTRLLDEHDPSQWLSGPRWRQAFGVMAALVVGATSLYGALALTDHLGLGTTLESGSALTGTIPGWLAMLGVLAGTLAVGIALARNLGNLVAATPLSADHGVPVAGLLLGLLVVLAGFYGAVTVTTTYADGDGRLANPTLDSLAFVEERHPSEAPAIHYLLYEVEGQPNMVSNGPGTSYRWNNAEASLTGVPTLVGWSPERGYRGPEAFEQRVADVKTIFTGEAAEQRRLLRQYDVEYVYLGPNERREYGIVTVGQLEAVSVEKQWGGVKLFAVDQSTLRANS